MKDYSKIKEYEKGTKHYFNENDQYHRLNDPAIEWSDGDKSYYINGIHYMFFDKNYNKLDIHPRISNLNSEYEKYIKQNIKNLIQKYNPIIQLDIIEGENLNEFPDLVKDLIII